jgi:hypothetical protein
MLTKINTKQRRTKNLCCIDLKTDPTEIRNSLPCQLIKIYFVFYLFDYILNGLIVSTVQRLLSAVYCTYFVSMKLFFLGNAKL